jgi:hypothetical protein
MYNQEMERNKTMPSTYLDFNELYEIEQNLLELENFIQKNVLTDETKNAIMTLSAQNMNRVLRLYSNCNGRKIDYKNKKVFLDKNVTIDYNYYESYINRLMKAKFIITDIQKYILGDREYNRIVYAIQ